MIKRPEQHPPPQTCCECDELIFGSELADIRMETPEDFPDLKEALYYHGDCYDSLAAEQAEADKW